MCKFRIHTEKYKTEFEFTGMVFETTWMILESTWSEKNCCQVNSNTEKSLLHA